MRNQANFVVNNKISSQILGNPEFNNPFDQSSGIKKQHFHIGGKSAINKIPFEANSTKKSNKIKQAKQLLAQRLKQVTTLQFQEPQIHQNNGHFHQIFQKQKIQDKNWDYHMNPISKLTKQPFVRSKTCDELRKQHSQKKQRKRNNSATKYSTPHTNQCQREVRSTGLNSKEVYQGQSAWLQSGEKNIQTKEFAFDPFGNNMIQTFDEGQIKKLSNDVNKKKFKGKSASGNKVMSGIKQQPNVISEIKYPFRINSAFNQTSEQRKSPNKFESSKNSNSSSDDLFMNEFRIDASKFTPRLERYTGFDRLQSPPQNIKFQKISINSNRQQIIKNQLSDKQNESSQKDNCFEYSDEQQSEHPFKVQDSPHPLREMRSGVKSSHNQNELVTSLHLTNTILEQKLRIKQVEIQELNRNYFKLKTQLLHAKNMQNQNIRYPQEIHNHKVQSTSLNNEGYLTNLEIENSHLASHSHRSHEFVNENHEIQSLPSPKFCDGVQEEFARERYVEPQRMYEKSILERREQRYEQPQSIHSRFAKKKQLFSSDMSEKVSEQFDSQQIYMPANFEPQYSNVSKKYVFKKSHFKENNSAKFQKENTKKDSLIYTLGQEQEQKSSSKKDISICDLSGSKPVSSNAASEQMLLEPITQSINGSSQKIDFLSPIKSHSTQKVENGSFRHSFRTSLTKSQNKVLDDSLRKFDYFLTPQKDQNTFIKHEEKQENEGLFEKAFSTLRKKRGSIDYPSQHSESHRYSRSSSKKQIIDPIIEHNIQ